MSVMGEKVMRAVTHMDVDRDDIEFALKVVKNLDL